MSIDKKAFGLSDSLVSAVNEALKGGQVKLDKNHNGKLDKQDFKMIRKEETVVEGNPANKAKKNAAAAAVGAKNKDSQYLSRMNPSVADKIRGREKMSGKDRQQHEEVEQVDELSTDTYHSAAHKAAKRAMGDAQGRSGPIFKKYAGMANKFRDKGMSQEKKEKAMKEETVDEAYGSSAGKTATGTKWSDNSVSVSVHHDGKKHTFTGKHDYVAKKLKAAHGIGMHQVNFKKASDMKEATDPRDSRPETHRTNNTGYAWDKLSTRSPSNPKDSKATKTGKQLGLKHSIKGALGSHGPKGKLPEETDPGFVTEVQRRADVKVVKVRMPDGGVTYKKVRPHTDVQHEANDAVSNQIAAKKDTFKKQLQQKIAAKQMNVMQSKANKRLSSINASNDKCSCQEGKGKSMTCEMHGDKSKDVKGGKDQIIVNPSMKEAAELPKKVITKGHEIAKSLIKHRSKVDNPYAVGMAAAKKSAKIKAYRANRDKNKED